MNEAEISIARSRCRKLRRRILEISQKLPALHIAPAFSCLELVDTIYFNLMRRAPPQPDTFILSKGHGAMSQFVILEELGILTQYDLDHACRDGGRIGGHPDYGLPGIEASTGSLGHGLPIALGMAIGDRELGHDRIIYLVMSDGELQEGSNWESFLLAPSLGLTKIVAFIDSNDFISRGRLSENHPNIYPLTTKLKAFGWETLEIDGHDPHSIVESVRNHSGKTPLVVVAHTTKGKGVSFMENQVIWGFRSPNSEEYRIALKELS